MTSNQQRGNPRLKMPIRNCLKLRVPPPLYARLIAVCEQRGMTQQAALLQAFERWLTAAERGR